MIAKHHVRAIDAPLGAAAGERLDPLARHHNDAGRCSVIEDRLRDGMLGSLLDRCRERDQRAGRHAVQRHNVDHARHPPCQRSRFVERDAPDAAGAFEVDAAFNQYAFARRPGQGRHDRDGRRNDQRARARYDEQHQRAIQPRVPAGADRERRHDRENHGEDDD